jgi:hypothetical protein
MLKACLRYAPYFIEHTLDLKEAKALLDDLSA